MLGDSCVDLGQGFPNFDPPEFVVKAGTMAVDEVLKVVIAISEVISEDIISSWCAAQYKLA